MSDNRKHVGTEVGLELPTSESWLGRHAPYILLLLFLHYCTKIAMEIFGDWFDLYDMLPYVAYAIIALYVVAFIGVVVRVVAQVIRRASWTTILRSVLGEPGWWRTWYPRVLRDPASAWDRLPPTLKVLRTVIWLELLLLPAGVVLITFVTPTFEVVYASLGFQVPLAIRTLVFVVTLGAYALPVIALAALVQGRRWRSNLGLSFMVAFNAFFSVSRDFWRDTGARQLLRS
jgi:hypothetical protein